MRERKWDVDSNMTCAPQFNVLISLTAAPPFLFLSATYIKPTTLKALLKMYVNPTHTL